MTTFPAANTTQFYIQENRFNNFFHPGFVEVHKLTTADLTHAWETFERFDDKDWSFTDCTGKVVMEQLNIGVAFAFDHHFRQFGSIQVVP